MLAPNRRATYIDDLDEHIAGCCGIVTAPATIVIICYRGVSIVLKFLFFKPSEEPSKWF
jgi:hypothetical protein